MGSRPWLLLYGEETFLVERALGMLRGEGASCAERVCWAGEGVERLHEAVEIVVTPDLFARATRLVVRRVEQVDDSEQELLLGGLAQVRAPAQIVLVGGAIDLRRRLFAYCHREGGALGFAALGDRRELQEWVGKLARERAREMTSGAVDALVDRVGSDLGAIAAEIEKLDLARPPGERLLPAHVDASVASTRELEVAELTDHLARRDPAAALRCLRQLLADGEAAPRILAFVAANLRRALHVAELREAGCAPAEIARRLGMPPWLVERAAGRGASSRLAAGLQALRRADAALKGSRSADALFERAILEIAQG